MTQMMKTSIMIKYLDESLEESLCSEDEDESVNVQLRIFAERAVAINKKLNARIKSLESMIKNKDTFLDYYKNKLDSWTTYIDSFFSGIIFAIGLLFIVALMAG